MKQARALGLEIRAVAPPFVPKGPKNFQFAREKVQNFVKPYALKSKIVLFVAQMP